MARLFLLRHAKAAWPTPALRDFDRPLDGTGIADAAAMGEAMAARGLRPGLVVCSTAKRAEQTWAGVAGRLGAGSAIEIIASDELYNADARSYLDLIRNLDRDDGIMFVGHNPTIEDVAQAFSTEGDRDARAALKKGFPTCGLAVIALRGRSGDARPGNGRLELFLTPSDL